MAKNKSGPKTKIAPQDTKQPRANSVNINQLKPLWVFTLLDLGGAWCWTNMDAAALRRSLTKLEEFRQMTLMEMASAGCHDVEIGQLAKAAQDRLVEIGQGDVDGLYSLRITGEQRLWAIRDRNWMKLLWYDPEHDVCPSIKKHT